MSPKLIPCFTSVCILTLVLIAATDAKSDEASSSSASTLTPPDREEIAGETNLIRNALGRAYARASEEDDFTPVIAAILKLASLSESGPRRYALMLEAERLALDEQLFGVAVRTIEERGRLFGDSVWDARLAVVDGLATSSALEHLEQAIDLATFYLQLCIASEAFPQAAAFRNRLEKVIADYGDREMAREAKVRKSLANYVKSQKRSYPLGRQPSATELTKKLFVHRRGPGYDADSHETSRELTDAKSRVGVSSGGRKTEAPYQTDYTAGQRLCLDRYDWEHGLPLIASGTGSLADVAKKELQKHTATSNGHQVDVANSWWDLSTSMLEEPNANRSDVASIRSHAAELYIKALAGVSDPLIQHLAEERIQSVPTPRVIFGLGYATENSTSPDLATLAYQMYLARSDISRPQRQAALVQLECWKLRTTLGCVRHGDHWIPASLRDDKVRESDRRLAHGLHLLTQNQPELAKEEMVAASQLNPSNPIPESVIAWVYCWIFDHDLLAAEHYLEAARRQPTNGLVLANLANCELLSGRHEDALVHYQRALQCLPDVLIANNVGWAIKNSPGLGLDKATVKKFGRLYRKALVDLAIPTTDNRTLLFVKPFVVPTEASTTESQSRSETQPTIEGARSGTGFVVAPGFVVTNHHVIADATEITITDPANPENRLSASIVATAGGETFGQDLALLRCDGLPKGEGIPLAEQVASRGEDVMALGYPDTLVLGKELKTTRGAVVSAVNDNGLFYLDCTINPGNSGGPIVDQQGCLIGVVVAITPKQVLEGNSYSLGIPVDTLRIFLEKHLPEDARSHVFDNSSRKAIEPLKWTEVDARVSKSTVFIQTIIRRGGDQAAVERNGQQNEDDDVATDANAPSLSDPEAVPDTGP
jgi:tetratricopeptide (TPR) repeat protein